MSFQQTLEKLKVNNNWCEIQDELDEITEWNRKVKYNSSDETKFPWSYQDHMIHILMIMNQLPLCSDLNWIIITMLTVKDVFEYN